MKNELTGTKIPTEQLGVVAELANAQLSLESEIKELEILLSEKKKRLKQLSEMTIPDKMLELGLTEIGLTIGARLSVGKFYSAKIPDEMWDHATRWLKQTGNDGIIKCVVSRAFQRGESEEAVRALIAIIKQGFTGFTMDESIHPQTLKAFVKERIESGQPIPHDLFGVYVGNKTTIRQAT